MLALLFRELLVLFLGSCGCRFSPVLMKLLLHDILLFGARLLPSQRHVHQKIGYLLLTTFTILGLVGLKMLPWGISSCLIWRWLALQESYASNQVFKVLLIFTTALFERLFGNLLVSFSHRRSLLLLLLLFLEKVLTSLAALLRRRLRPNIGKSTLS